MATEKQRFVDEEIRPIAEAARALVVRIQNLKTSWFAGKNFAIYKRLDAI